MILMTEPEEENSWGIPRFVTAHRRTLGWYWNAWVDLWGLDQKISRLMDKEAERSPWTFLLLLPSALLVGLCRIPFTPLDIYDRIRRRRWWKKQEEEREEQERAELYHYRRHFGYVKKSEDQQQQK